MADISMCVDKTCPSRVHCYRYRAKPSRFQSYSNYHHKGDRCESYSSTSGRDDRELLSMEEIEKKEKKIDTTEWWVGP